MATLGTGSGSEYAGCRSAEWGPAVDARVALDALKLYRRKAFRHTWDVQFGPQFLSDYESLSEEMKETVISAVSIMANAKHPLRTGRPLKEDYLYSCEIGRSYEIIFDFQMMEHAISLHAVRTSTSADPGMPVLRQPDPSGDKDAWLQEVAEESIEESYKPKFEAKMRRLKEGK